MQADSGRLMGVCVYLGIFAFVKNDKSCMVGKSAYFSLLSPQFILAMSTLSLGVSLCV